MSPCAIPSRSRKRAMAAKSARAFSSARGLLKFLSSQITQGIALDPIHPHDRKDLLADADPRLLEIEIDEASDRKRAQLLGGRVVLLLDRRNLAVKATYCAFSARGGDRIGQSKPARHHQRQAEVGFRARALAQV